MSHNIFRRDAQYGVEMAWHKLTKIRELLTREEVFPWEVILEAVYLFGKPDDTGSRKIDKHNGWVVPLATDDYLPLGKGVPVDLSTYTPETPAQVWEFNEEILKGTGHTVVSAGTVDNRGKFFISNKLNELEAITLDDGSTMELILNSLGSMDKSLRKKMCVSGTRTVCKNTLLMNFLGKQELSWAYKHSKNMKIHVQNDTPAIEKAVGFSRIVKETLNSLVHKPCDKDTARAAYAGFICMPAGTRWSEVKDAQYPEEMSSRAENMVEEHVWAFEHGDGNSGRTEFDLLNGWTEPRTRGYAESDKDKYEVFTTSEFGSYAESKSDFAKMLTDAKLRETVFPIVLERGKELIATA